MSRWRQWLGDDALVSSPGKAHRRSIVRLVVVALIGWSCVLGLALIPYGEPVRIVPSMLMGLYIAYGAIAGFKRLRAYRRGWVDGRMEMARSVIEATRRGMPLQDWYDLEWERTAVALHAGRPQPVVEERTDEQVRGSADQRRHGRRRRLRRAGRWLAALGGVAGEGFPGGVAVDDGAGREARDHGRDTDAGYSARDDGTSSDGHRDPQRD